MTNDGEGHDQNDVRGAFGFADGAFSSFDQVEGDLVRLPGRFGGISRDPSDSRVRIVAGPLGSGKTFLLKRMQNHKAQDPSVHASDVMRNDDLTTELISVFADRMTSSGNTEAWSKMWHRAILMTAWSFIRNHRRLRYPLNQPINTDPNADFMHQLAKHERLLEAPATPRRVSSRAAHIISTYSSTKSMTRFLNDEAWEDIEFFMAEALQHMPPLYLYVDDIDRNYSWHPANWTACQRGLFYTIINHDRPGPLSEKLCVVASIRDVTMATIAAGEHAVRYVDEDHVVLLNWSSESIHFFLSDKVRQLPEHYISGSGRDIASWLGFASVRTARAGGSVESVSDYLVRHTRMVPRDIVVMGNRLCRFIAANGHEALSEEVFKDLVSEVSRKLVRSELVYCANHTISEEMPPGAVAHDYDHAFLQPGERVVDDRTELLLAAVRDTSSEVFGPEQLADLDERVASELRNNVRVSEVFWQHRLLAWIGDDDRAYFFNAEDHSGRMRLPRGVEVKAYAWHCMLFDIVPNLRVIRSKAVHP